MLRIRRFLDGKLKKFWSRFGYTMLNRSDVELREKEFVEPKSALTLAPGVKLLKLTVWTEGEHECPHHYHRVRALNSHKNSVAKSGGKHEDFVCSECTHKMCQTKWGDNA